MSGINYMVSASTCPECGEIAVFPSSRFMKVDGVMVGLTAQKCSHCGAVEPEDEAIARYKDMLEEQLTLGRDVWVTADRPGFFGRKRAKIEAELDERWGVDNWREAWKVGNMVYDFNLAIQLYEDAYFEYLLNDFDTDKITPYTDVYDNNPSNVESGLDYEHQETTSNHFQDISIRRVLIRMGRWFHGEDGKLLHVRGNTKDPIGAALSPGVVPFHLPHLIIEPELKGWWKPESIESFWQSNKVIIVRDSAFQKVLDGGMFQFEGKEEIYQGSAPGEILLCFRCHPAGKKAIHFHKVENGDLESCCGDCCKEVPHD